MEDQCQPCIDEKEVIFLQGIRKGAITARQIVINGREFGIEKTIYALSVFLRDIESEILLIADDKNVGNA